MTDGKNNQASLYWKEHPKFKLLKFRTEEFDTFFLFLTVLKKTISTIQACKVAFEPQNIWSCVPMKNKYR